LTRAARDAVARRLSRSARASGRTSFRVRGRARGKGPSSPRSIIENTDRAGSESRSPRGPWKG